MGEGVLIRRLALVALVVLAACGSGGTADSGELASALDRLKSADAYHVRADVDGRISSELGINGHYEMDVERPSRSRTLRYVDDKEVSRVVALGDSSFLSDDGGASWTAVERPSRSVPESLAAVLAEPCSTSARQDDYVVKLKSPVGGCNKPTVAHVVLKSESVLELETSYSVQVGTLEVRLTIDLGRKVPAIVSPVSA